MNQQVAAAFKKLYFGKRTGVLMCEAGSDRRAVYFQSGFVVGAKSTRSEDRLGEVMMRHGRIDRQQFEDASHFIKSGWKLGEILAELNVIAEEEIEAFVRLQLLDIACMQLVSPPRRLAFSSLSGVDSYLEAPLSVADILMEAARRTPRVTELVRRLGEETRCLGFSQDPMKRFQDVNLKPEEAFVLSRIDGTHTPGDIFAVSPLSEEQTARALFGLLETGIIELEGEGPKMPRGEAAEEQPEKRTSSTTTKARDLDRERADIERLFQEYQFLDHWQVLGLEPEAGPDRVQEAFFEKARRYHPDRFRRVTDPEFQERLSFVFRRVNEAYETLSSRPQAESYRALADKEAQYRELQKGAIPTAGESPPRAGGDAVAWKSLFRRAQSAYKTEDFWECIQLSQQAIDLEPGRAAAYHLLGLALARNPKWRQDAEKNLKIAVNLDPWKVDYLVALGKLYQEAGLNLRARKAFEQAKAIDPEVDVPEE